jgi:hypothetical protein
MTRLAILYLAFAWSLAAQVAILQIQVVEGEGVVHPPGSHTTHLITVAITDEANHPVAGAAVSFHLPENGPGGAFANGLRTEVALTDARGRCTLRSFAANRIPGPFQIRIVASKEQARAGTVSFQYIGELKGGPAVAVSHGNGGRRKWIAIAAIAGGGAVAGVLASRGSGGSALVPVTPPPPVLTIGNPTISVGKP